MFRRLHLGESFFVAHQDFGLHPADPARAVTDQKGTLILATDQNAYSGKFTIDRSR